MTDGYGLPAQRENLPPWTPLDDFLLFTCDVVADVATGRADRRPPVPSVIRLNPGEHALAMGPAERFTMRAPGDGSYTQSSTFAFGSPTFVAGALAANAIGNSVRRNNAARGLIPRWMPDGFGDITITDKHVQLIHPVAPLSLYWNGLDAIELPAPGVFQASFQDIHGHGFMSIRLHTPWASLIFALAAIDSFPAHPRLLSGSWLPPYFEQHCAAHGRYCRPAARMAVEKRGN
jgi:hypothetical protein